MNMDPGLTGMAAFAAIFGGVIAVGYLLTAQGRRLQNAESSPHAVAGLTGREAVGNLVAWFTASLPQLGKLASTPKKHLEQLRTAMLQAGFFQSAAPHIFIGARLLLTLVLALAGVAVYIWIGPAGGKTLPLLVVAGCVGFLAPGFWLSSQVARRQRLLRTALPDVLDMLVLCLEGGISLNAAIQRVSDELLTVHPAIALEMNILQREMQLGLSAGEALRKFADRCGLADVRDLSIVIIQSEHYGASVTRALRNFADNARQDRQQRAEELAQKAAVKILFPTLLCIFPAIFVVVVGPAAFQIAQMFSH